LVDDGSTDRSGKICDTYAERYVFIHVHHNTNHGLLFTRRFAMERASGEYIINLDSDDSLVLNALEVINQKINQYHCDCVIYGLNRYYADKNLQPYTSSFTDDQLIINKRELCKEVFSTQKYNSLCRKAVKRSIIGKIDFSNYYYIAHGEDLLQSVEIYRYAESFLITPENLYNYRITPYSMIHTKRLKDFDPNFTVQTTILHFLEEQSLFDDSDYKAYRSQCVIAFIQTLQGIADIAATNKEKIQLLSRIDEADYYRTFLRNSNIDRTAIGLKIVFFDLYNRRHFKVLIALERLYTMISGGREK